MNRPTITINKQIVEIEGERNILDCARKAGIDIPTFCYHSDLSVYGACRLCLVEIEGRGIVTSCSTAPEPGMVIRTHTEEIRKMRQIALELILANHEQSCPTCEKSASCQLQKLARVLGVKEVRFRPTHTKKPVDVSSASLVRDPNKCILCGDCVRACQEIQGIGALDFAYRGAHSCVVPAFGKDLANVACVGCGLCSTVCPTGALTPKSEVAEVWSVIENPKKKVVVQLAPAVRVAIGEMFGLGSGMNETGRIVAALKAIGFDAVFDTSFAADLTVLEEGEEFIARKSKGVRLPQFTSCCPAWVTYVEQFYPMLLDNLSSCRSPQQMFGSLGKKVLPEQLGAAPEDVVIVSIMPCVAKKVEAKLDKFTTDGRPDVDFVLTTTELGQMIEGAGLRFEELAPQSLDMPFGFKTGAGVIFGASGGVTEAVLRYAVERLNGPQVGKLDYQEVRGDAELREATVSIDGVKLKLAVVYGLKNAGKIAEQVKNGSCKYDLVEVMACPGGCVGGAGQPTGRDKVVREKRAKGLYDSDRMLEFHKSQDNHLLRECYASHLGEIGGEQAHSLLHTHYHSKRRIEGEQFELSQEDSTNQLLVSVCVGTSCFVSGSEKLLRQLMERITKYGLQDRVKVRATFCFENCLGAPNVMVGDKLIGRATTEKVWQEIEASLEDSPAAMSA